MNRRSNQTNQLLLLAFGGITLMIAIPAVTVLTPWYSNYFFKTLKTDALEIYKGSGSRANGAAAKEAVNKLALSLDSSERNLSLIDLHILEELSLRDTLDGSSNTAHLAAMRSRLNAAGDDEVRAIIRTKLVRCQLAAARAALSRKEAPHSSELLSSALEDLKAMPTAPRYNPPSRYLDGILSLSSQVNSVQGKQKEAQSAERLRRALKDPLLAKEWYQSNNLANYDCSYPADYLVYYLLSSAAILDPTSMKSALDACEKDGVNNSTKYVAIKKALAVIEKSNDIELIDQALALWCKNFGTQQLRTGDLVMNGWGLYKAVLRTQSAKHGDVITKQLIDAVAIGSLPDGQAQQLFNNYETTQYYWKNWPSNSKTAAIASVTQLRQMQSLCRSRGLDDAAIKLSLIPVLMTAGRNAEAKDELREELDACSKNQPELQERLSNFCGLVGTNLDDPNTVSKESCEIFRYALNKTYWLPEWRFRLLTNLGARLEQTQQKAEADRVRNEALKLAETTTPSTNHQAAFDTVALDLFLNHHKFEAGRRYYRQMQARYAHNQKQLADIAFEFLHLFRSFPNVGTEVAKLAAEAHFPDVAFKDAAALTLKEYGASSEQYHNALFWLAQYELCRRDETAAIALSRQAFDGQTSETTSTCLAAKDFYNELSRKAAEVPTGAIPARFGTEAELYCLWSLYTQFGRTEAAARALKLKAAVVEGKR